ncbi:alpha/beta fold hydrolase [Mycobacterium sp. BMJ-28]
MPLPHLAAPTLARTRLGSGPGLLLAHGAGSSMTGSYGPILEGLAAHHTVVGIDYPGSGGSPRSTTALSIDELVAAADAEGLDRFAVSGYSLGGPIAIRAATRHPQRVTALVLTAAFAYRDNRLALVSSTWSKIASTPDRGLLGEFLLMTALGTDALQSMPHEQLQQIIGFAGSTAADGSAEQVDLVGRLDVRDDLAAIKTPTLIISTTDDRVVSTTLHRQLAQSIANAEIAEIATGHLPMLERGQEWLDLIDDFLAKHHA